MGGKFDRIIKKWQTHWYQQQENNNNKQKANKARQWGKQWQAHNNRQHKTKWWTHLKTIKGRFLAGSLFLSYTWCKLMCVAAVHPLMRTVMPWYQCIILFTFYKILVGMGNLYWWASSNSLRSFIFWTTHHITSPWSTQCSLSALWSQSSITHQSTRYQKCNRLHY